MKNPAAVALGRLARGVPKNFSAEEIARRSKILAGINTRKRAKAKKRRMPNNEKGDEMKTSDETKAIETGSTPGRAEAGHTPGPWNWADGHARTWAVYAVHATPGMITWSPEPICEIPRPDNDGLGWPEAEANARLIASAPCLLAALRALVAAVNVKELDPLIVFLALEKARAAIERAEGGLP